jgi:hypothetical protein
MPRMYQWMGIPPQPRAYSHGGFKAEGGVYPGETFRPIDWTPEATENDDAECSRSVELAQNRLFA